MATSIAERESPRDDCLFYDVVFQLTYDEEFRKFCDECDLVLKARRDACGTTTTVETEISLGNDATPAAAATEQ